MEQFIFDVLKMYIEFILYNYESVKITYLILLLIFWMSIGITASNLKTGDDNKDGKFIAVILILIIVLYGIVFLLPSPETLQALIK